MSYNIEVLFAWEVNNKTEEFVNNENLKDFIDYVTNNHLQAFEEVKLKEYNNPIKFFHIECVRGNSKNYKNINDFISNIKFILSELYGDDNYYEYYYEAKIGDEFNDIEENGGYMEHFCIERKITFNLDN